jgi:predicted nucleic-acid-binding Zn-ribbon protein
MAEPNTNCPKCQNAMEVGFLPDATYGQHVWFQGVMPNSIVASLRQDKQKFDVTAYRCVGCGFLEFYARP